MNKEDVLNLLTSTKNQTLEFFTLEGDVLQKTYGPGKWSIRQILHHLADSEHIFLERLKRVIAGPRQVVWAYDQDMWNNAFNYLNEPLGDKGKLFEICRELIKDLFDRQYDNLGVDFVHSEAGLRILREEFERVATHNLNHIQQIQIALSAG